MKHSTTSDTLGNLVCPVPQLNNMAASHFSTTQYTATQYVESVGAIAIRVSTREICLVHHKEKDEWLLPKGRRNVGESRPDAGLRELKEETGFSCRLLPLTMTTRATSTVEIADCPDEAREHRDACEPFMLTHRSLGEGELKIIWWYIAAVDEDAEVGKGEEQFGAYLLGFEDALARLTFEGDREIVREAIRIFEENVERGTVR